MDQAEIRRRNFIPAESFPYTNAAGVTYDSGNYERALDRALELTDYNQTTQQITRRRHDGEIVGIGIASCVEVSGGGEESGTVTLQKDGRVKVITGASPHGQGLVTSLSQIISDELGVPLDDVTVVLEIPWSGCVAAERWGAAACSLAVALSSKLPSRLVRRL